MNLMAFLSSHSDRLERERLIALVARPLRALFAQIESGETLEVDGVPVFYGPNPDRPGELDYSTLIPIGPNVRTWALFMERAGCKGTTLLHTMADRLDEGKPLTPRMVEKARQEFEEGVKRMSRQSFAVLGRAATDTAIKCHMDAVTV